MTSTVRWVIVVLGAAVVLAIVVRQLGKPEGRAPTAPAVPSDRDRMLDEEVEESFPASDAPSHWAGGPD